MNKHEDFLKFGGKVSLFTDTDGSIYIPIKQVCEAMQVDANRAIKNVMKDRILSVKAEMKPILTVVKGETILKNALCLPERNFYGWLLRLRSRSPELIKYKETCFEVLHSIFSPFANE